MRTHIIAMGKWKKGPEKDLFETYGARMRPAPVLKELDFRKKLSGAELKQAEAELLLNAVPNGAVIVALDERGKTFSSREFAGKIQKWQDQGRGDIAFIIGGADGLDESVRARSDLLISFGSMTWPHMLVRPMLAEQLFRASAILSGHPYHRD
ncbi:23S rRNA (pseudouridine(1915)-N(3))-methyltransferase RlmH [Candidatus Terasakiella magnetica]|uniref:23S rRNA (pseudouridine(1915)-N(3))-methyltransferase RlmH n=1 Tax=Candidatus Terasakiella magnetica TaxID=1867952 RepID=UPI000840A89C|nr:23S rRNA (pseudouridine(1915)-N(3))-methyltransferase RlmH [Candidatus Terasakiella magnetica]